MDCRLTRELASLYADGLLSGFEHRLLESHLRECEDCRAFVSVLPPAALPTTGLSGGRRNAGRGPPGERELGTLLARAIGYRVLSAERRRVGVVDHLRYRSRLDLPDAIAVASSRLAWRRLRLVSLSAIDAIDPEDRTVLLRLAAAQIQRLPRLGRHCADAR